MRSLITIQRYSIRKLKNVQPESWVQKPADVPLVFSNQNLDHLGIKYYRDVKQELQTEVPLEEVQPCSPKMGPYKVENPRIHKKTYRWCSCGMSNSQPFCDNSHEGTAFKPLKFTVEEKVLEMNLCGCKLSESKPFCDGHSCRKSD